MQSRYSSARLTCPGQHLGDHAAEPHHQDAVGDVQQFLRLARHEDRGQAALGLAPHDVEHLLLRLHVDAPAGFVEEHHLRLRVQPVADDDLLLVAARQRGHRQHRVGHLDRPAPPPAAPRTAFRARGSARRARRSGRGWPGTDCHAPTASAPGPPPCGSPACSPGRAASSGADRAWSRRGPSSTISPASNGSAPKIARSTSVRPAPSSPAKPSTSPRCRSNETSSNTSRRPSPRTCSTGGRARCCGAAVARRARRRRTSSRRCAPAWCRASRSCRWRGRRAARCRCRRSRTARSCDA